ncbi:hypothetical protein [Altibacter sp. HG106]|uniref:hypothetical protein n=1 Tax=Altibacter sp. HG106 TaxID=3023937 RepID=UPI002350AF86|nr:hypothetical protein [Altibacter sp. HG106]MDC7995904.1 hypothetical protein [Altibacter sp. HG106]
MKAKWILLVLPLAVGTWVLSDVLEKTPSPETKRTLLAERGCVFMTTMGSQSSTNYAKYKTNENILLSVRDGLSWLAAAQLPNGGYGAGSHNAQHVRDPHAVPADPATTAMVAQALLRSGNTFEKGTYALQLKRAVLFLLETIESSEANESFITEVRGTQIQRKLGENIDAVLTAQLLSNVLDRNLKGIDKKRITRGLDVCIDKIESGTDASGKQMGAGWAGVLQSGLATSALESAKAVGVQVDEAVMDRSRKYQEGNYNKDTGAVSTEDGAGIMLYAVSGSVRGSAAKARKAKKAIERAKRNGILSEDAEVNAMNLKKAGFAESDAMGYATSYEVYESAKQKAQEDEVMNGFGNNGGEEFLSFLQTGESLLVNEDDQWKQWYDDMSGRILKIQNDDGSWNGHHCITSPVFCTATSLLLLTVENDIDFLKKVGAND